MRGLTEKWWSRLERVLAENPSTAPVLQGSGVWRGSPLQVATVSDGDRERGELSSSRHRTPLEGEKMLFATRIACTPNHA